MLTLTKVLGMLLAVFSLGWMGFLFLAAGMVGGMAKVNTIPLLMSLISFGACVCLLYEIGVAQAIKRVFVYIGLLALFNLIAFVGFLLA